MLDQLGLFDQPTQGSTNGEELAQRGQRRAARANVESIEVIKQAFVAHLRNIAPAPGSVDTLRGSGFTMPHLTSGNAVGTAINQLARARVIRRASVVRSTRPEAHGGWMRTWFLANSDERRATDE